jgi:hypothetical protein
MRGQAKDTIAMQFAYHAFLIVHDSVGCGYMGLSGRRRGVRACVPFDGRGGSSTKKWARPGEEASLGSFAIMMWLRAVLECHCQGESR